MNLETQLHMANVLGTAQYLYSVSTLFWITPMIHYLKNNFYIWHLEFEIWNLKLHWDQFINPAFQQEQIFKKK